ncbi:MAG TPA: SusD/RagB family nutrient-binding outer membrane lipoprotein, partial [Saprospiraceae bacterium]|nr:SusD/RagB family nutrient-binding outer membrane lipoprotein [Saprospiraceae bacterium]
KTNDAGLNTLTPTILFFASEATQKASVVTSAYIQQIGSVASGGTETQLRNTFAATWNDIYLNIIPNANNMVKKAASSNSPHYAGIAKTVIAYSLGLGTSLWENIPYKDADNQLTNFFPKYDTQEDIYKDIIRLLDEAIVDLGQASSVFKPGTDDLIYKGNISNWLKTAHSLKARYLLHLSKRNGTSSYAAILTALNNGIKSNAEDFQLIYNDRNLSRWHQVALANNTGNVTTNFSKTLIDLMNGEVQGVEDPRLPIMAFKTVANDPKFNGMLPGRASGSNTRYKNGTTFFGFHFALLAPHMLMTNAESRFIEAEVRMLQNGGNATTEAYNAYLDGIRANMTKMNVPATSINSFIASARVGVGAANLTLSNVLVEKYKALFLNPEAWNDLRRYNYSNSIIPLLNLPELHNPDLGGQWIQRGAYPDSEGSRNAGSVQNNTKDLNAKMWIFN